jgi:hypothetical protein
MSCPSCGGTVRQQIAPGYWRCLTQLHSRYRGPGVAGHPEMGPEFLDHVRTCGRKYQEGAPVTDAPECHCGTFAIGRCAACQSPVCGDHSALVGEVRMCLACAKERRAKEAERTSETETEHLRARRDLELRQISEISDSAERVVAGVVWCENPTSPASLLPAHAAMSQANPWGLGERRRAYAEATRELLDAILQPTGLMVDELILNEDSDRNRLQVRPKRADPNGRHGEGWPWDSRSIGKWFARTANWGATSIPTDPGKRRLMPPHRLDLYERRGVFKRWALAERPEAWQVRNVVNHSGQDYSARVSTAHVYVLRDGRVIRHTPARRYPAELTTDWDPIELSARDLRNLAELRALSVPGGLPAP